MCLTTIYTEIFMVHVMMIFHNAWGVKFLMIQFHIVYLLHMTIVHIKVYEEATNDFWANPGEILVFERNVQPIF